MIDQNKFINPSEILKEVGIEEGLIVADFGCGTGIFTLQIAKLVGDDGKVYAIDVLSSALESVQGKAKMEGVLNIETVRGNLEVEGGAKIPENSVDAVLLANTLLQSKNHKAVFTEAKRVLKSGGQIIVIDWIPEKSIAGKNGGLAVSQEQVEKIAASAGFVQIKSFQAGSHHYGIMFRKP